MTEDLLHPYLPNSASGTKRKMLEEMGLKNVQELFSDIPKEARLERRLELPRPKSELEVKRHIEALLSKNKKVLSFLGAGCWPHYVPSVVDEIVGRAEFITSYTPYQPEISQGMLQAQFEFQSLICELTGMDFANSSMYDWASALGEAARMVARVTGRNEFLVPRYINPERLATLRVYAEPAGIEVVQLEHSKDTGQISVEDLGKKISSRTAGVYVENPSYLGYLESGVDMLAEISHKKGALFIVGVDPVSLGILKPPADYGADIVIGEGQPLGNHMNYGGPLLGIFACKGEGLLRQMPGRIIGMTSTVDGREKAFCMTLQTREQHIRREKATSNICTNEALCAVAAAVYLSLLGPAGLRKLCETILVKSNYAMRKLRELTGVRAPLFDAAHFKEFTVNFDETGLKVEDVNRRLLEAGIQGGVVIKDSFPALGETALYCVTEIHSRQEIDRLVETLRGILEG